MFPTLMSSPTIHAMRHLPQGSVSVNAAVDGGGKVTLQAVNLTVNGRTISVGTSAANTGGRGGKSTSRSSGPGGADGDVVDVEYTER